MATDAERVKNFPGVLGFGCESPLDVAEILFGAGEPESLTLLTDFLNAFAIGVESKAAIEVTLDKVFFLLLSTSPIVALRRLLLSMRPAMSAFLRFLFLCKRTN